MWYGYVQPDVCDNLLFRSAMKPVAGIDPSHYDLEHVLEWQAVTKFFDWVNQQKSGVTFRNPDRSIRGEVGFCEYWAATWTEEPAGGALTAFPIAAGDENRLPLDHMRSAYLGREGGRKGAKIQYDEFVYLHKFINSPAKANVSPKFLDVLSLLWDFRLTHKLVVQMWTKKDQDKAGILKATRVTDAIKSTNIDEGRVALLDLKNLLGARKYMSNKQIQGFLKNQKVRMGDMIRTLDAEMANHPKPNFEAWRPQQLGDLWDRYMDFKFEDA